MRKTQRKLRNMTSQLHMLCSFSAALCSRFSCGFGGKSNHHHGDTTHQLLGLAGRFQSNNLSNFSQLPSILHQDEDACEPTSTKTPPLASASWDQAARTMYPCQCRPRGMSFGQSHSPIPTSSKTRCPLSNTFPRPMFQLDSKNHVPHHRNTSLYHDFVCQTPSLWSYWFCHPASLAQGQPLLDHAGPGLSHWGCGVVLCFASVCIRRGLVGGGGHVCRFSWVEYALVRGPFLSKRFFSCRPKTDWE